MLLIISWWRLWSVDLQLVFGIDEETAEADDLIACLQAARRLRVEFALNAGLDLHGCVLAFLLLDVDDVLGRLPR